MKLLVFAFLFPLVSFSNQTIETPSVSPSVLNETVQVTGFGDIRMRKPLPGTSGFPVLLVQLDLKVARVL